MPTGSGIVKKTHWQEQVTGRGRGIGGGRSCDREEEHIVGLVAGLGLAQNIVRQRFGSAASTLALTCPSL